jgi:UDP-perosamine 4-acetyltransferase
LEKIKTVSLGLIVIGAGGHAKVCIEILQSAGMRVDYCIAADGNQTHCLNIPVLHGDHNLDSLHANGYVQCFIALGSNKLRAKIKEKIDQLGFELINAISPFAHVSPSAKLGRGIAIMPGAIVNAAAEIDDLAIINTGASIDHDCQIGFAAHVAPQSALAGHVKIGKRSFLGIGAVVIPEMIIGDDVTVGAGSVIVSNICDGEKVMGVPAKAQLVN